MISVRREAELVDAVRGARVSRIPFEIVAGGTKRGLGRPGEGTVLDVSGLTGILKYEPEELIITARPGTPLNEITHALAEKNQRLGFDPPDWSAFYGVTGLSTLGGAISADACGSGAVRHGRARDHLLGYRAVNGLAEAYKAGGKVVKNVTGFDLSKLMCGAMGTLGVLTEVTLRVFPKADISACFVVNDIPPTDGLAALRRVWNSTLDATGLAYLPPAVAALLVESPNIGRGAVVIRLEGARASLDEKRALLDELLAPVSSQEIDDGDEVFRGIGSGAAFATSDQVWLAHRAPADAVAPKDGVWLADCAGGRLWQVAKPHAPAILMRADNETRRAVDVFPVEPPALAKLTRAVKAAFDPLGLFNPGRMYKDI